LSFEPLVDFPTDSVAINVNDPQQTLLVAGASEVVDFRRETEAEDGTIVQLEGIEVGWQEVVPTLRRLGEYLLASVNGKGYRMPVLVNAGRRVACFHARGGYAQPQKRNSWLAPELLLLQPLLCLKDGLPQPAFLIFPVDGDQFQVGGLPASLARESSHRSMGSLDIGEAQRGIPSRGEHNAFRSAGFPNPVSATINQPINEIGTGYRVAEAVTGENKLLDPKDVDQG